MITIDQSQGNICPIYFIEYIFSIRNSAPAHYPIWRRLKHWSMCIKHTLIRRKGWEGLLFSDIWGVGILGRFTCNKIALNEVFTNIWHCLDFLVYKQPFHPLLNRTTESRINSNINHQPKRWTAINGLIDVDIMAKMGNVVHTRLLCMKTMPVSRPIKWY